MNSFHACILQHLHKSYAGKKADVLHMCVRPRLDSISQALTDHKGAKVRRLTDVGGGS